jgi:hypothetical protein
MRRWMSEIAVRSIGRGPGASLVVCNRRTTTISDDPAALRYRMPGCRYRRCERLRLPAPPGVLIPFPACAPAPCRCPLLHRLGAGNPCSQRSHQLALSMLSAFSRAACSRSAVRFLPLTPTCAPAPGEAISRSVGDCPCSSRFPGQFRLLPLSQRTSWRRGERLNPS